MSRIRQEMGVIPRVAWVIAVALYLGLVLVTWNLLIPRDPKLSLWQSWGKAAFALFIPMIVAVLVLLVGYVYGDARRRGMRYVLWTLLAIFVPNGIGIILYFILRDPPMRICPRCGAVVRGGFAFCQACGTAQAPTCTACHRGVDPEWSHCPNCGAGLQAV